VLSAVLRTAVKWGHLQTNPARDIDMPTLKTVRPRNGSNPDIVETDPEGSPHWALLAASDDRH
jgi:hypothetical protein